jgi:hypothetical protein
MIDDGQPERDDPKPPFQEELESLDGEQFTKASEIFDQVRRKRFNLNDAAVRRKVARMSSHEFENWKSEEIEKAENAERDRDG